jgi:glycosyltransferase involved in cell wall biosynthesis
MKKKLSVVLATYNEEKNIGPCLESVRGLADEIIIVDGSSTDKTRIIARQYGAKIIKTNNPPIFHINKQKALDAAKSQWILQLDADERVTPELADEIKKVIQMSDSQIKRYQQKLKNKELFLRHQRLIEKRDGKVGRASGKYAAFFLPRRNFFLGKFLRYGGTYPDGVIRLVRAGKAYFPCKSVHEQIVVNGRVGWLQNDLLHIDSPNFKRYLIRNSRYIDLIVDELKARKEGKNFVQFINYFFLKPIWWFLMTTIRHKGVLDGWQGIVFSLFSSLRFPRAYWRYITRWKN